jgi:glutaminase
MRPTSFTLSSIFSRSTRTDAHASPQQLPSNASSAHQRPCEERPLTRNPRANSGLASKLRNSVVNHVKVLDTEGKMINPVIVTETMLGELIEQHKSPVQKGYFVDGIPGTDPKYDVRSLTLLDLKTGKCVTAGTRNGDGELVKYSQQSMSKPVAEALAIKLLVENGASDGMKAFRKMVGFDASGRAYNDHATYPDRPGVPFNSSVNKGALKTWDIIITEARKQGQDPFTLYLDFERQLSGNAGLDFKKEMAEGEFGYKPANGGESNNMQMLAELKDAGNLQNSREEVYLAYCQACAIMINTEDSAHIRAGLRTGKYAGTGEQFMSAEMANLVNRSTAVHGMYDESGMTFVETGASVKSGVDGGLMASLPSRIEGNPDLIFASHHAALNANGNSLEGKKWLRKLSGMPLIFADDAKLAKPATVARGALRKMRAATPRIATTQVRSPEAIDRELRANLADGDEQRLQEMLRNTLQGKYKGKFYLKEPKSAKSLEAARYLFSAPDVHGNVKRYYHVPDNHHIEKVVVVQEPSQERQALPSRPPEAMNENLTDAFTGALSALDEQRPEKLWDTLAEQAEG